MSDDDLYDDLETDKKVAAEGRSSEQQHAGSSENNTKKRQRLMSSASSDRPKSLTEEVDALQAKVGSLQRENSTLKRNIGILYRTAIAELKRKDAEIATLHVEIDKKNAASNS